MEDTIIRDKKYKRFEIIKDNQDVLALKLNYKENLILFIVIIVIFLIGYFLLLFIIETYVFILENRNLKIFAYFLISAIFFSFIIICLFFLIRGLFFKRILKIDKISSTVQIETHFGIFTKKKLIPFLMISNVYIKKNTTVSSYGLKLSNYSLVFHLSNGILFKIITSLNRSELTAIERLIINNVVF
ncbi:MAG: hypothetical protein JSV23_10770 [Promethearchaeota archaeon]|nr:MAG: hypothetical protein JSV23_10770 [Candidatus Lokiarchaeota archaeon]